MNRGDESRRIYVVDDDDAFRDSLRWLLESAGYRVAVFSSAERFLASHQAGRGACLLLDVRMPGLSGIELQAELNRRGDGIPVIFLTGHGDVPMAVEAVKKGAYDFVEKPFANTRLLALIEKAAALDAPARRERAEQLSATARLNTLTEREREVLDRVCVGRRNKQIAEELGISIKTVEAHRAHAMEKMGAASIAEVVRAMLSGKASR
ncbi:MAG: response regulator transcription factor [Betaproteobacteria bacterium]|nr:response regulator transcription factor [Betaproteobacteria bacterium]